MPDQPPIAADPVPRVYCTAFDANYLCRGLALWRSLRAVSNCAVLWVCCLDQRTYDVLVTLRLPRLRPVGLAEIEQHFPALTRVKPTRSLIEYYFTLTPSVLRYVLDSAGETPHVTYLDADLYFFADPQPLFEELAAAGGSVGIIAHRFPERLKEREKFGVYNVGWITILRDARGLACLDDWQERCIEWCYARVEDGKFADQKYLDSWPERFPGVVVLQHPGANVALWNLDHVEVAERQGKTMIGAAPLLFYHFHAVTQRLPWLFRTSASAYDECLAMAVRRHIYAPYFRAWRGVEEMARRRVAAGEGDIGLPVLPSRRQRWRAAIEGLGLYLRHLHRGEYLFAPRPAFSGDFAVEPGPEAPGARAASGPSYARMQR